MHYPKLKIKSHAVMRGEAICRILRPDGTVRHETKPKSNLILYGGIEEALSNSGTWEGQMNRCAAGTGTTANSASIDGTFAQSGTTVTRSTGTGEFSAGDVGKTIKFSGGEEAYITAYTSATEVEVRESATVSAATVVIWNTARTALDTEVKESTTLDSDPSANTDTANNTAGTVAYKRTFNFSAEVGTVSYTEVGIRYGSGDALLSRVVLDSAVNVNSGEQLQVVYTITMQISGFIASTPVTPTITGWPYPYTITDITHGGSSFDVTLNKNHHYSAGDEITIASAVPTKTTITAISSTGSDFTVTAAGHGLSVSDSIEIEGCSVGAYNGTWTVATVPDGNTFTVTSAANPGAATDGTVRLSTPGTYFNGTWTIASIPTTDSIRITDATIDTGTPAGEGDLEGTLAGDARFFGEAAFAIDTLATHGALADPTDQAQRSIKIYQNGDELPLNGLGNTGDNFGVTASRSETFTTDTNEHSLTFTAAFDTDEANFTDIKQICFQGRNSDFGGLLLTFDQNQRKDSGYILTVGYTVTFRPTLA